MRTASRSYPNGQRPAPPRLHRVPPNGHVATGSYVCLTQGTRREWTRDLYLVDLLPLGFLLSNQTNNVTFFNWTLLVGKRGSDISGRTPAVLETTDDDLIITQLLLLGIVN
jgi:hypothetical protein